MDPATALVAMRDDTTERRTRLAAAEALRHWLCRGGFTPAGEATAELFVEIDRTIGELLHTPPRVAPDGHLESACDDRNLIDEASR